MPAQAEGTQRVMRRRWNFIPGRREPRLPDAQAQERSLLRTFWLATTVFAALIWLVLILRTPLDPNLQLGMPSPVTIQAVRDARFYSTVRTEAARTRAESAPTTVSYKRDPAIPTTQRSQLMGLLQTISQIRDDPTLSSDAQTQRLAQLPDSTMVLTESIAADIVALDDEQWAESSQLTVELYDRAMREGNYALNDQDVESLRTISLFYWANEHGSGPVESLAVQFVSPFLRANLVVDDEATQRQKQAARDAVQPVEVQVLQGESIVRQGDLITAETLEKLQSLGQLQSDLDVLRISGRSLLAILAAGMLGGYMFVSKGALWRTRRKVAVVYGMAVGTLLASRLVLGLPMGDDWYYALPLGATVLLLAALFGSGVGLMAAAVLSMLVAFVGGSSYGLLIALLFSSFVAVFTLGRADSSIRFLMAGLAIAGLVMLVQAALWLMSAGLFTLEPLPTMLLASLINGTSSAILALGLYNLVSHLAGVVTPFQLMELSNPSQPLLRKLIREAPGTYYHSLSVGNLAESAAEAIGADALLLRVAAYYHDVGKAARPYFYTDNQSDRENVHNDLDPQTSAQIIADHVREGVNMARAARLPEPIVSFIPTHHGTSIIQHFYQMAMRMQDSVDVADFRYPGPRPHSREQAILMLADSVEATVRAKSQHGKLITARQRANGAPNNGAQTLEELVSSIIDERMRSGQLDECELTLADFAKIRQAFVTTLQGIYHPRVEYAPQLVKT